MELTILLHIKVTKRQKREKKKSSEKEEIELSFLKGVF